MKIKVKKHKKSSNGLCSINEHKVLKNKKFELKAHQKLFKQMMTTITNQTLQIK